MSTIEEIDQLLERLERGEHPDFLGPRILYGFFARRLERQLLETRAILVRQTALWKPPPKPKCRGPSILDMACAQLTSYSLVAAVSLSLFIFVLWYTGILAFILWFIDAIRTFIGLFVSSMIAILYVSFKLSIKADSF
jgi:hypothetical protein